MTIVAKGKSLVYHAMQQIALVFVLFIDYFLLVDAIIQSTHHSSQSILEIGNESSTIRPSTSDLDQEWRSITEWITPFLIIFTLFVVLICPCLLWFLQDRWLDPSIANSSTPLSSTRTIRAQLLTFEQKSQIYSNQLSTTTNSYESPESNDSMMKIQSFLTPRTSSFSTDEPI